MLRSSMKKIIFFPEGGPKRVFRFFSNLVSNMSCQTLTPRHDWAQKLWDASTVIEDINEITVTFQARKSYNRFKAIAP